MRESDIQNLILMALSDAGCKVWRQNVSHLILILLVGALSKRQPKASFLILNQ